MLIDDLNFGNYKPIYIQSKWESNFIKNEWFLDDKVEAERIYEKL